MSEGNEGAEASATTSGTPDTAGPAIDLAAITRPASANAAKIDVHPAKNPGVEAMLDVHPPHEAIHTWKHFFIHIITITIGLLIALALEQTVEHFHRLNQLQTVRHELAAELQENRQVVEKDRQQLRLIAVGLAGDMALLRARQVSQRPPARPFSYSWDFRRPRTGAWEVAKQSGVLDLMPHGELLAYAHLYDVFDGLMQAINPLAAEIGTADAIARRSPDGTLLPHDIEELVTVTSDAQGALNRADKFLIYYDIAIGSVSSYVEKQ